MAVVDEALEPIYAELQAQRTARIKAAALAKEMAKEKRLERKRKMRIALEYQMSAPENRNW